MSAPDSRAPDAALRQRVRDAVQSESLDTDPATLTATRVERIADAVLAVLEAEREAQTASRPTQTTLLADRITDAVLAAIPEPAPTPKPRRVELDGGRYAMWDGEHYCVKHPDCGAITWKCVSAANTVVDYVYRPKDRDAKHAELIALKSEEVKPFGWVNKYENGGATMFKTREYAKSVIGLTREPVPVYEHPPAATQSETREVLGHGVMADGMLLPFHQWFLGIDGNYTLADTLKWAHEHVAVVEGGTVVELLRGAEVTP